MQNLTYSKLREQSRISLLDAVPLSMPLSMYVDPSSICNFSCIYCPQSFANKEKMSLSTMSYDDFERVVSQVKSMGKLKTLNLFSFGEPLLNPHTPEFLKIARENDIAEKYVITTNASLLNEEKAKKLVDNGLSFIRISIYSANQEKHQERTKSRVNLEEIKHNISFLKQYRDSRNSSLSIAVKMLDTSDREENKVFLENFSQYADDCFIEPLHNWHDEQEKYSTLNDEQKTRKVCPYPFYTLVTHANLDISVCCPDWDKKLVIGNLKEENLQDIWRSKKLYKLQDALLSKDYSIYKVCEKCSFYKINAGDNLDLLTAEEYRGRRA